MGSPAATCDRRVKPARPEDPDPCCGQSATDWPGVPRTPPSGRISVVIPAFNGRRFLSSCLRGIEGQAIDDLEVIVVDDGSSDGTTDLARELGATMIEQVDSGVSQARNRGFVQATDEFVVFQDQDDRLAPGGPGPSCGEAS